MLLAWEPWYETISICAFQVDLFQSFLGFRRLHFLQYSLNCKPFNSGELFQWDENNFVIALYSSLSGCSNMCYRFFFTFSTRVLGYYRFVFTGLVSIKNLLIVRAIQLRQMVFFETEFWKDKTPETELSEKWVSSVIWIKCPTTTGFIFCIKVSVADFLCLVVY